MMKSWDGQRLILRGVEIELDYVFCPPGRVLGKTGRSPGSFGKQNPGWLKINPVVTRPKEGCIISRREAMEVQCRQNPS